jgi:hypothetical protein
MDVRITNIEINIFTLKVRHGAPEEANTLTRPMLFQLSTGEKFFKI